MKRYLLDTNHLGAAIRLISPIRDVIRLSHRLAGQWNVPIHQTVASTGEGVAELVDEVDRHLAWMLENGVRDERAARNAATRIRWAAEELVRRRLRAGDPAFDAAVEQVTRRRTDPASAARELVAGL